MPDEPDTGRPAGGKDDFLARMIDALVDLLETLRDWVRQEAEETIREKVVLPLQKLGITVASAMAAAMLLVTGAILIGIAAIIALGNAIGYAWIFFGIGAIYLIGSALFLVIKMRSMQR
jgi:hypothetical protein